MVEKSIAELEEKILYHKKKYYNGEPEISDQAYDQLEEKLKELDPNSPVLHLVGSPEGGKVEHNPEMLSAQKAKTLQEVSNWAEKISYSSISVGYKVDGLSLSLIYKKGRLIQAATRGNGSSGDDVTPESMKVQGIPTKIDSTEDRTIVRGEVYMKISEFHRINKETHSDEKYASPRNLAAGTLKNKDLDIFKDRRLDFMAWELVDDTTTIEEQMNTLKSWGFDVADFKFLENTSGKELDRIFSEITDERRDLDFEIDGVIFKYNDPTDRQSAGVTEHHPKWSIAWKFQSEGEVTKVLEIVWQVGRTGALTPVAEVEPVDIAGATIRRATLHNADFVETLNVAPGDTVSLIRSGDVIPKIIDVVDKGEKPIILPQTCPSCGSELKKVSVELICTGSECKDKNIEQIAHWVNITEMKGLGRKSVEKLYNNGIITHYADFYDPDLKVEQLEEILGKNGRKFYKQIERTRELNFDTFLAALGIQGLGPKLGKTLAMNFDSYEELKNTSIPELTKLDGISEILATYIIDGINDPNLGDRVLKGGITIKTPISTENNRLIYDEQAETISSSRYSGKTMYITGSVRGLNKQQLQAEIEKRGIEWKQSISSKLDYLVYGENAGTAKLEKAKKYEIEVIPWEEFNNSLDNPIFID